jgi:hypothetical protein
MTYILVALAPDGTRHPLGRQHVERRGCDLANVRTFVDPADAHRLSRKAAERAARDLNGWDDVRRRRFRVVVEAAPSLTPTAAPMRHGDEA